MIQSKEQLNTRYRFTDYLFYTALLFVPVFTALVAIWRFSAAWALVYGILAIAVVILVLKFFCTRCPHYTRDEKLLRCIFFWGLPKMFSRRPGKLDRRDLAVTIAAPAVLVLFSLVFLLNEPGLLTIYLVSIAVFAAAVRRYECPRCIYTECPSNKAPVDLRGGGD
jgi:hypothetical protein